MAVFTDGQIIASIHDFKTYISKYIRMLDRGEYRAVIVRRYEKVGVFLTMHSQERWEEKRARAAEQRALEADLAKDNWDKP